MLIERKPLGTVGYMGGVPSIPEPFLWSWTNMLAFNSRYLETPETYIHHARATCSYHTMARNQLVNEARGEWLFMLDTDHAFAPDLLARLLNIAEKYQAPVVSGAYVHKFPPYTPVACVWNGDQLLNLGELPKEEVVPVGVVGAGNLLVKRSVFRRIKKELGCDPFDILSPYSEDYSFCRRCRDLGIPILLATQVQCHHLVTHLLATEDFISNWTLSAKGTVNREGMLQSIT